MAKQLKLDVQKRPETGKGVNRRLRAEGMVPAVFYDGKGENISLQVKQMPLLKAYGKVGSTQVFQLNIEGDGGTEERPTIIWRLQHHPFKNQLLHVDFYGVDLKKKLQLEIPVDVQGEPKGVREDNGILTQFRDVISVLCLPMEAPESISVDVSDLAIGDTIHIEDIELPDNVEAVYDENYTIVTVQPPSLTLEEEEEAAAEAEEAALEAEEGEEGEEAEGEEAEGEE
jgi:large subunit ribosomal protein L25